MMKIVVPSSLSGELARRLVQLQPGSYRLDSSTSAESNNAVNFELSAKFECAEPNVAIVSELQITPRPASDTTIVIEPKVCRYFRIILYGSADRSNSDVELLLRRMRLVSLPGQGLGQESTRNVDLL